MNGKFFLDTNILIYTFDTRFPNKKDKADKLISRALINSDGIISYQVAQEFLNVASRKFSKPLSLNDCQRYLDFVLSPLCEIFPSISLYQQAIKLSDQFRYSFYDSLIIASAIEGKCQILYSEDLQSQQTIQGMTIINPFV